MRLITHWLFCLLLDSAYLSQGFAVSDTLLVKKCTKILDGAWPIPLTWAVQRDFPYHRISSSHIKCGSYLRRGWALVSGQSLVFVGFYPSLSFSLLSILLFIIFIMIITLFQLLNWFYINLYLCFVFLVLLPIPLVDGGGSERVTAGNVIVDWG